jgi:hypothetical protein
VTRQMRRELEAPPAHVKGMHHAPPKPAVSPHDRSKHRKKELNRQSFYQVNTEGQNPRSSVNILTRTKVG